MFGLPSLTIWSKLAIAAAWTATVAVVVGTKVDDYVTSKYESILLQQKVVLVEKVRTVAVLDQKTLQAAIIKEREQWQAKLENERLMNEILRAHQNDPPILTPDELRLWNDQNSRLMGDAATGSNGSGHQLPDTGTSEVGKTSGPVAK